MPEENWWVYLQKQLRSFVWGCFYFHALLEVYNSWKPARETIEKIYDDVVWSSPMRTTPERSKRLDLTLENRELNHKIEDLIEDKEKRKKISRTFCFACVLFPFLFSVLEQ